MRVCVRGMVMREAREGPFSLSWEGGPSRGHHHGGLRGTLLSVLSAGSVVGLCQGCAGMVSVCVSVCCVCVHGKFPVEIGGVQNPFREG